MPWMSLKSDGEPAFTESGALAEGVGSKLGTIAHAKPILERPLIGHFHAIDATGASDTCPSEELQLTRFPRLCDLMSRNGLAYLFLGIEA